MSNLEANKVIRALTGERLKFTCRVHLPDNQVIEFQSDHKPKLHFQEADRALWLVSNVGYGDDCPIMRWADGSILLVEENPK